MNFRLYLLAVGMFALGTDSFVIAGILPQVGNSFSVSPSVAGQMVTVYALAYAIFAPVIAAAAASWPRKQLLLLGMTIFVAANILTIYSPSFHIVLVGRAIAGLGAAMFSPTATSTGALLVPPEQRGRALATVVAGLSIATAFGSPLGTALGGLGDWRITIWFVVAIGMIAGIGIAVLFKATPIAPAITLRQRLSPLGDGRIALTLLTSVFAYTGLYIVYTYIALALHRATSGSPTLLASLLLIWGIGAVIGNLGAGLLVDRFGGRPIISATLAIAAIDYLLIPFSSATYVTAAIVTFIWGIAGWGLVVGQQHRLISVMPASAPLLLGLSTASIYLGSSASGLIGAAVISSLGTQALGFVGAFLIAIALVLAELAHRRIHFHSRTSAVPAEQ